MSQGLSVADAAIVRTVFRALLCAVGAALLLGAYLGA